MYLPNIKYDSNNTSKLSTDQKILTSYFSIQCERVKSCHNLKSFQKSFNILSFEKDGCLLNPYFILLCKIQYDLHNISFITCTLGNFEDIFFPTKKEGSNLVFD